MQYGSPGGRRRRAYGSYLFFDRVVQALVLDAFGSHAHDHAPGAEGARLDRHAALVALGERLDVGVGTLVDQLCATVDRQPAVEVAAVDGHDRDTRIGKQIALLGPAAGRVEDDVLAIA